MVTPPSLGVLPLDDSQTDAFHKVIMCCVCQGEFKPLLSLQMITPSALLDTDNGLYLKCVHAQHHIKSEDYSSFSHFGRHKIVTSRFSYPHQLINNISKY